MRRHPLIPPLFTLLLASPALAQTAPVQLTRTARIGCADCDGPQLFSEISGLATDGRYVYVTDTDAPHVRIFRPDGALVRAFGREGRGPGELIAPHEPIVRPDGSITVFDVRQSRIVQFDSTGALMAGRTYRVFPMDAGYSRTRRALIYSGTDFATRTLRIVAAVDRDTAWQTLHVADAAFPTTFEDEPALFVPIAVRADGGFAIGSGNGEYRIRVHSATGSLERELRRALPPLRRSPEELEAAEARLLRGPGGGARNPESGGGRRPQASPVKPHFNMGGMKYDSTGRLWVLTNRGGSERGVFDLFGARGEYLGELEVPVRVTRFDIAGSILAGVTPDADDVAHVTVWRFTPGQ